MKGITSERECPMKSGDGEQVSVIRFFCVHHEEFQGSQLDSREIDWESARKKSSTIGL